MLLLLCFALVHHVSGLVDVFTAGEAGYYCIKIPSILQSSISGDLLAFGEARMKDCSDYTWTDIVMKRSSDGGATWSNLTVVYSNSTEDSFVVIGNAAAVQERSSGNIIMPFCRNNLQVMLTISSDDGYTWSPPRNITSATLPEWKWVGTGPPSSIQLESGRIVTPSYHDSWPHWTDGDISEGHVIYSDDLGVSWSIGGMILSPELPNECQAVDLGNNTILVNARSTGTYRLQSLSYDGGMTFTPAQEVPELREPGQGCEGSIIRDSNTGLLFFSNPSSHDFVFRTNMSIHSSDDNGSTWHPYSVVDPGPSGYSSLVQLQNGSIALLYERAPPPVQLVFVPLHISFLIVWSP